MADDGVNRIGAMMEQLGARFELLAEAVTGINGRIDNLRTEIVDQFAEVGKQMRFISGHIADNREALHVVRAELGEELIRLNEAVGATRVELHNELASSASGAREELRAQAGGVARNVASARDDIVRGFADELKKTNKTIAALGKKFDHTDDRMTIDVKDHEQRLRKLERRGRA